MCEVLQDQVTRQIEEAFSNTPYPGDEEIGRRGIEFSLRGKHWREISIETIHQERFDLGFLTASGFRFYLPSFMLAALNHYLEVDTLPENLILQLSPDPYSGLPDPPKLNSLDILNHTTSQFTQAEALAVLAFLKSYRILNPENLTDTFDRIYGHALDTALEFWEAKAKDNTTL